jgi:hypothetical protein
MWVVLLIAWVPATTAWCITMQNTLALVHPQFRKLEPGLVWLAMIPAFGIVWQFVVVFAVARSLRSEFYSRSITAAGFLTTSRRLPVVRLTVTFHVSTFPRCSA